MADTELRFPVKWWHWIIETCPNECFRAQMPVPEEFGDDCILFEKLDEYRRNADTCSCGKKHIFKYRHASADHPNVEEFYRLRDSGMLRPITHEHVVKRVEQHVVAWEQIVVPGRAVVDVLDIIIKNGKIPV